MIQIAFVVILIQLVLIIVKLIDFAFIIETGSTILHPY
jgi:hypothetical protein